VVAVTYGSSSGEMTVTRLAWAQLRFRVTRTLALLTGLFVAATAFTVLTAASRTAQLRTVGTITASYSPSYDILVRPKGARTALEDQTGTVQPNFLSGIYGGITMAQWRQVQRIQGVQVAAPIAMIGYVLVSAGVPLDLSSADYDRPDRQLYRFSTTWVSAGGATRITQPPSYVYYTPDRIAVSTDPYSISEVLPGGSQVEVCAPPVPANGNPFGVAGQTQITCGSKQSGWVFGGRPAVVWNFPMLIAAIDPDAEAKLDGLSHALSSGRYLAENAADGTATVNGFAEPTFPVLATTSSGVGEEAVTTVQRLATPARPVVLNQNVETRDATAPGQTVLTTTSTAQQAYKLALKLTPTGPIGFYYEAGPVSYRRGPGGSLIPVQVTNPASLWTAPDGDITEGPPIDQADSQYRPLRRHENLNVETTPTYDPSPLPVLTGTFNPGRITAFNPLSQVPLGPYQAVTATPADAASAKALGGGDLLPNLNMGGLVSQPAQLLTSLSALPALENANQFGTGIPAADPISVIRVRVAGVTGPNVISRVRINQVAQQIATQTGLDVDIVAGSSPVPVRVGLPAGKFGQPSLALIMDWVKKGVAVTILTAVDRQSVLLFTLILLVCVLYVANAAWAAVRGRRRELGVLACLGWQRSRLFGAVLGEVTGIGLVAGLLGAAAALPVSTLAGLRASPGRALLAVPVAVLVAVAAGAVPAWLATRAEPTAAIRPTVLGVGRAYHPRGVTSLGLLNVARTPGRALIGVLSLAVGIAGLTVLTAVTFAFRGVVVGSLLGDAIAVQVRAVDYVAIAATVLLGVLGVADVLYLNIRERASELATIRSLGWRESALARLVITDGAAIGLLGSLIGAGLGLAMTAWFAGQVTHRLVAVTVTTAATGLVVTAIAAVVPAALLRRLPAAHLLAEE
jgi:putative ABC transport system permease protein